MIHRIFHALHFRIETPEVAVRARTHHLSDHLVLLQRVSCLPESGRQALEVLELLGAHCVGVLLSQPGARLQPCFNACKAGRQDGRRSEMRAGTPVDTPMFNSAWGRDTKHCRTVIATEGHVSRRPGRSRGGMRHTNTLVGVDRRADQSLDAPRMLNYAGDEL